MTLAALISYQQRACPSFLVHGLSNYVLQATQYGTHASCMQAPGAARALSSKPDTQDWMTEALSALGIKMYPDLVDASQRELAKTFRSMGKVLSLYRRPRTRAEHGLIPELEDWSYYWWNKLDTFRVCKQSILGFSTANVLSHASTTFQLVHAATSTGSPQLIERLRELAVPSVYEQLKADIQHLHQQPKVAAPKGRHPHRHKRTLQHKLVNQSQWQIVNIVSAEVVDAAVACPVPDEVLKQVSTNLHCAQLTVRFVTKQRNLTGDEEVQTFEDFWVFERPFYKSWIFRKAGPWGAKWRLLAQLDIQDVPLTATAFEREQATSAARGRIEKVMMGAAGFGVLNLIGYGLYSMLFQ